MSLISIGARVKLNKLYTVWAMVTLDKLFDELYAGSMHNVRTLQIFRSCLDVPTEIDPAYWVLIFVLRGLGVRGFFCLL